MKKKGSNILIVSFAFLLILPNIFMLLGANSWFVLRENKRLASFPKLTTNVSVFFKNFNTYYRDNFGIKNLSYKSYRYLKTTVLNEYPLPNKVVRGKDGWFFLGDFDSNVFSNNVGATKITNKEYIIANKNIDNLFYKFNKKKVPFYYLICPDKHEIYKEYLPFTLNSGVSKFDLIIDFWKKSGRKIIDLEGVLRAQKKFGQLYYKTDSHWNDLGAFYGFNELINQLNVEFPSLKKLKLNDFELQLENSKRQDLISMIDVQVSEDVSVLKTKSEDEFISAKYEKGKGVRVERFINLKKKLKVIVFRDSYSKALMKYFKVSFGETIFIKSMNIDYDLIEKEKPDLVILQMINRKIEKICTKELY